MNLTFSLISLFGVAFGAGLAAFYLPRINGERYRLILVFAGAYLFSITLTHLLPELFLAASSTTWKNIPVGVFVLIGFFLQQGLEFFSNGVEHGHIHIHTKNGCAIKNNLQRFINVAGYFCSQCQTIS